MRVFVDGRPYEALQRTEGGMGIVYRLRSCQPVASLVYRKELAAKTFKAGVSEREIRGELEVWLGLSHPNILPLLAIGTVDDELAALSPWRSNGTLADIPSSDLTPADLRQQLLQASCGLDHAWKHNILHLDVKPSNLFRGPTGNIEVGDWGIARLASESALGAVGQNIHIAGTLPYMGPERFAGCIGGPATDLFSLAMTGFEVAFGWLPYTAEIELPVQICTGAYIPAVISACTGRWARWKNFFLDCLAMDPKRRPQTYGDFAGMLKAI